MAETNGINLDPIVVIGGSTGSIDVLLHLLPALPNPLPFAVIIVIHRKNTSDSSLANLLTARGNVLVQEVDDKEPMQRGRIYLAPADYHLLLEQDGTFSLDDSEKVQFSRPSINVTFESVADVQGRATVGILLSGANADGTDGLRAINQVGGTAIVQDPATAQVGYMPQQAILNAHIDHVLTIPEMIRFLHTLH